MGGAGPGHVSIDQRRAGDMAGARRAVSEGGSYQPSAGLSALRWMLMAITATKLSW